MRRRKEGAAAPGPAAAEGATKARPRRGARPPAADAGPVRTEALLAAGVACALASAIWRDLAVGGLGTSNGRIVSFLASLNSAAGFRGQRRAVGADVARRPSVAERRLAQLHLGARDGAPRHKAALFLVCFLNKFGTQGVGSLLVGATPVILKGPRHVASWFAAFFAVQLAPRDVVYDALRRHVGLRLVVKAGAAVYKLRKFNFVVGACDGCSAALMLAAMLVTIDGNNACSRLSTWAWLKGPANLSAADVRRGAAALLWRSGPVALAAALVRCCGAEGRLVHTTPELTLGARALVLVVFLHRNDVAALAAQTLRSLARRPP